MILAERAARIAAEAKAAEASAVRQGLTLELERLKLEIARLRRERFGPSAERSARLEQLELSLEDLEEAAAEAQAAQAPDPDETTVVGGFTRRKPARRPPDVRFPSTCRARGWSIQPPPLARAVAGACASWAKW
jgi:transposase